jgi:DNA (cytosine-5)-methyltransferase 1
VRERVAKGRQVGLNDLAVTLFGLPRLSEEPRLLPTPMAQDSTGAQPLQKRGRRARLNDVTVSLFPLPNPHAEEKLLPTPRASDGTKGSANQRGSRGDLTLPSAAIRLATVPEDPRMKRKPKRRPRTRPY